MSYKLQESNGNWVVIRESQHMRAQGREISYKQFKQFSNDPKTIGKHFIHDEKGQIIEKARDVSVH